MERQIDSSNWPKRYISRRWHPLFLLQFIVGIARPISGYGMSEKHAENHDDYPRENQVKRRRPQPGLEQFPFLPEKISDQGVGGGIGRRPRKVVKQKSAPWHFRHAGQQIDHDGRKQEDEPCDKNRLGAMTFEKSLRPLQPFGREMEPADFLQAALAQPSSQPESTDATQKAGRRSGHHGLPQRIRRFTQNKSCSQKKRFSREWKTEVVQKRDDEDEHISVVRNVRQQRMQPVEHGQRSCFMASVSAPCAVPRNTANGANSTLY